MMRYNKIFLLLSLMLLPSVGWAEDVLSIDACREMALKHNKDRQSAALSTQSALYTQKSVWAQFFPNFSLVGFGLYDTGDGTLSIEGGMLPVGAMTAQGFIPTGNFAYFPGMNLDYKVNGILSGSLLMKQPLYMGGKIRAGYRMSKMAVDLYRQNERLTEAQVIQQVDEAYAQVVKAKELEQVAMKYQALLQELDKNVESAARHGMRMENDRMKVQVKLSEVELQLRRAQNGVRLATMNLCHVTGQSLQTAVQVSSEYPAVSDAQELQTTDVSARPEYAMLDYQAQIAEQQVKMSRSEMLPQIALLAKYGYTRGAEINDRMLMHSWNFAGGVTVSVPLYHFGEHLNKVKAAKAKLEQAQLERDNKSEMMLLELTQAANNLDEARLEVALAEKTLDTAEKNMNVSGQQYKAGVETLSDYLEAQALWQQAYESRVDAYFQLYLSSVKYLKASGNLISQ